MISLKNVNKYYNKGKQNEIHVINDVSLELPKSGMVALFGKSGCGKTTLLNAIGGLTGISKGTVTVDGQDMGRKTDLIRNKYIGYVFQNYILNVNESVYENVADALRLVGITDEDDIEKRVIIALKNVGMDKFYKRMPETLSGGQQQRVAIARAIVKNPEVILADEPTGNLDENNTIMVMDLLKQISKDHLVLLVTHEADLVDSYCDTVIELRDGSIINQRDNANADGYYEKNKNNIYLGELDKAENDVEYGHVSYYGKIPENPLDVKIVNHNGMLYLKLNTDRIRIIDEKSEIKLVEGTFTQERSREEKEKFEIEPLGTINEKKVGRLFTLKQSLMSGWKSVRSSRKSAKGIRIIMTLFSVILVLLTAYYGVGIKNTRDVKNSQNPNVFYAYLTDESQADYLSDVTGEHGIDYVSYQDIYNNPGDITLQFLLPEFESSKDSYYGTRSVTQFHSVVLAKELAQDIPVKTGNVDIEKNEVIITTAVADQIIKNCKYDFVDDYDSLIGFSITNDNHSYYYDDEWGTSNQIITGIVESKENAVYCSKELLAAESLSRIVEVGIRTDSEENMTVEKGQAVVKVLGNENTEKYIKERVSVGEIIKINGRELTVSDIRIIQDDSLESNDNRQKDIYDYSYEDDEYYVEDEYYTEDIYMEDYEDDYIYYGSDQISYILNEEDYYKCAQSYGECSGYGIVSYDGTGICAVIHANDADKAKEYLCSEYDRTKNIGIYGDKKELYTPEDIYEQELLQVQIIYISMFVVWVVLMAILCLCVYLIMRGNTMENIKIIGIYRSIGATKKNIIFKFFCELMVLLSVSSYAGYIVTSIGIWLLSSSKYGFIVEEVLYYPFWLAFLLLLLITAISVLLGLIPVMMVLSKSPSDIIAKYDV